MNENIEFKKKLHKASDLSIADFAEAVRKLDTCLKDFEITEARINALLDKAQSKTTTSLNDTDYSKEFGTVEGRLLAMDNHDGYKFAIFEPLHGKKIMCSTQDEKIAAKVYVLWEKRVAVDGMITYSANGDALQVIVESISEIYADPKLCDYKLSKGILKEYV